MVLTANFVFVCFYYFLCAVAPRGPGRPHSRFCITHNNAPHSVRLLWTSDQLHVETSTWQHTTFTTDRHSCPQVGFEPTVSAGERPQTYTLGYGYIGARTDTTQQSGQTPDKEVEIKSITVYVSGYTETDTTGMLSPPNDWRQQSELVSSRQSGQTPAAVRNGYASYSCHPWHEGLLLPRKTPFHPVAHRGHLRTHARTSYTAL